MNRTIFLHIGMPKTGTTAIQNFLSNNSRILNKNGILFPNDVTSNHSNNFTQLFMKNPQNTISFKMRGISAEFVNDELDGLRNYWSTVFNNSESKDVIISAENLFKIDVDGLYALHEYLVQYFDKIKVILYVRGPTTYLRSNWEQHVKTMGRDSDPFKIFTKLVKMSNSKS